MAYNPKSKRTNPKGTPQQVKNLNGLTANKNIDDIRALSKISNGHGTSIDTLNSDVVIINGEISSLQKTKQDNIKLTTTGSSGPATLSGSKLNIPDYSSALSGYVPTSRTLTINGTTYDLSANRTWNVGTVTSIATTGPITGGTITGSGTIGITQATTSTDGYLSSTDWNTFNNKQNAITLTTVGSSGPATLIGSTLNIPNYNAALTGYVPYVGATQNVNLGEFGLTAGQLTLDTSPTGTAVVGTTRWNNTIGSSETTLKGGSVILKNGVDLVARVVNKVTPNTTLTKAGYAAVRVSGAQGQRLAVAYAQANNDNNSADTIGLVAETIATNQEGFIITVGQLEEINTTGSLQGETWVDGDVLYLSPTTPGALTNIKPNGSTGHIVVIGYVEYAHANHGKIYVKIMNGWELDELHNVYINNPLNNQGLFYETSTQLWKNKSIDTALGYTPVPTTRQLTINGTTYDLSANRTWSVGTVTAVTASSPLSSSGGATPNITISQASGTDNGYLSSTDWTTFNNKQPAGNYITALSGEATGSGPGTASVTLNNASVTAKVLTGVNVTGGSINASDSILTAFGKLQNQINGLIGSSIYQGVWNASTNTPALTSGVGTRGYYYIVNVAGSTNLDGITDWNVGDWAIFDGTAWQQVDNTDSVTSVNGQTGAVSLTSDNIPEGVTNLYFTNLRARQALTLTTLGTSGAATYSNTTGVLNIPQYQSVLTNPVTGTGTTNYVARWTSSSEIGTGVLYDNGTNVGIGTASPIGKLSVDGGDFRFNYGNAATSYYAWFNHNSSQDGGILLSRDNSTLDWQINNATGGNLWFYAYGLGAVALTMQRSNGFVGIGTTAPSKTLDVFGNARFQNAVSRLDFTTGYAGSGDLPAGVLLSTWDTSSNNLAIIPSAQGTVGSKVVMGAYNGSVWRSMVEFANTSGEPNLLLAKSAGNVGIGTTTPGSKLDIVSTNGDQLRISYDSTYYWEIGREAADGRLSFTDSINGEKLTILSGGNVGIGTTNPLGPLEVYRSAPGSLGGYIVINNDGSSVYNETALMFGDGNASGIRAAISTTTENSPYYGQINFKTGVGTYSSLSTRMTITGAGNVGIGTSSPAYKLTVEGRAFVDQFQYNQGIPISGIDLNDLSIAGFYAGSGLTNAPEAVGWYFVTVERHSDSSWVHQTATSYGAGNTANRVYTRVKSSGTWGAWKELADNASISGTTNYVSKFTSGNTIGNSLIYDNGTNVGIGTTGPSFKFEVIGNVSFDSGKQFTVNNGNGNSYEVYYTGGTGANSWRHIYGANGTGYGVGVGGYGIYYQGNGNYNQINFPNGNTYFGYSVGIGTNTPTAPLDTNGVRLGRNWAISNRADIRLDSNGADYPADILFGHTSAANETDWNGVYWSLSSRANALSNAFTIWRGSGNPGGSGEEVMLTILPAGNIGMGTTAPTNRLDVIGTSYFSSDIYVGQNRGIFFNGNGGYNIGVYSSGSDFIFQTAGSEKMRLSGAGNLGIGTTTPTAKLDVISSSVSAFFTSSFNEVPVSIIHNGNSVSTLGFSGLGSSSEYHVRIGANATNFVAYTNNTERMRITSAGNVGIGNTFPSGKLDVSGTVITTSTLNSTDGSYAIDHPGINTWKIGVTSTNSSTFHIGNDTGGSFVSKLLSITQAGNVGIGTASPGNKLTVAGSVGITDGTNGIYMGQWDGSTNRIEFVNRPLRFAGYYGNSDIIFANNSDQERMRITSAGYVGIGTSVPQKTLEVVSGANNFVSVGVDQLAVGQWSGIHFGYKEANSFYRKSAIVFERTDLTEGNAQGKVHILNGPQVGGFSATLADAKLTIAENGNVGIGVTSPSQTLHVAGNARVTGAYYDSNNQAGTSGQILSSTGSGTDWVDSPTSTATSVAQLLPSATVNYSWVGQVIDGTWVDIFTRANNVLTTGVWMVTMYVNDHPQGGNHYTYRYSGTMTWYQGGTNQTGLPAASEIALHRMGHAANNCILYLRTTEEAASDGGNGKLQINANYSNTSNTTITFTFVKII